MTKTEGLSGRGKNRLENLNRGRDASIVAKGKSEVVPARNRIRVVGAEPRLPPLENLLVQLDRVPKPSPDSITFGKVVTADKGIAVVGPEPLLPLLERLLVQRDSLAGPACFDVRSGECIAALERCRGGHSRSRISPPSA